MEPRLVVVFAGSCIIAAQRGSQQIRIDFVIPQGKGVNVLRTNHSIWLHFDFDAAPCGGPLVSGVIFNLAKTATNILTILFVEAVTPRSMLGANSRRVAHCPSPIAATLLVPITSERKEQKRGHVMSNCQELPMNSYENHEILTMSTFLLGILQERQPRHC